MREVTSSFTPREIEASVQKFWTQENIYARVQEQNRDGKTWFFVDGPPYTTGHIHLGTAWNKILKDSILRYKRMHGLHVIDRAGYDMHGLPIEVRVEHELGFKNKKDIEAYGIGAFIERCKQFALHHKDIMSEQFQALGVWMNFDDPYQTIMPEYIEAAWWTLQQADEKGLLERGHRVVNWCPRCETAIADSEVEYWDEQDPSIFVKFPIRGLDNEYLVIWTTTPWTLPANVAVAVDKDFTYARVEAVKDKKVEILWIAKDLVEPVLKRGKYQDYSILSEKTGEELAGIIYDSPLAHLIPRQKEIVHTVVTAGFVEMDNTGMVHIAPGHGWDDYLLGVEKGLDVFCPVDGAGYYTADGGSYAGQFVRDANEKILEDLGSHLLARQKITHRYGHCWRCKTPIIYRATSQWFISVPKIKEKMLSEIKATSWYPDWAGSARFYDFVSDARDWCISRQRYWGIPIPVWQCSSCQAYRVFGTVAELNAAAGSNLSDPHRPYVDEITVPCSCGGTMKRVEDIFDVWFDSAMASWATLGFPRNDALFHEMWPADFITEGQDQTRGWFYSQLGASTIAFNRSPYKSVLMHGFALDAEGRKMSKSLGNVVTPEEVVQKFGVDVLRLYILSSNAPWEDLKFNWDGVSTVNRTMNILWNVYRFPLPYMILDGFSPAQTADGMYDEEYIIRSYREMPEIDRWIISRMNSVARHVSADMNEYQLHRVTRLLMNFILEDLSRWYVQIVRPRMWLEEDSPDKRFAYETIAYCLRTLCRLLAPFTPHITEAMYENLRLSADPISVHMLSWPVGDARLIDEKLEQRMDVIRSFDEAVANARQAGKRKLRWPVRNVVIVTSSESVAEAFQSMEELAKDRANTRNIEVIVGSWDRMRYNAEPVMKKIGPAFGKKGPVVKGLIESADGTALRKQLEETGLVTLSDGSEEFVLTAEHMTFSQHLPDQVFGAEMSDASVYVDTTLTEDLEAEGYSREIIRRLQEMRKQLDLNVDDNIVIDAVIGDEHLRGLLSDVWQDLIKQEVRGKTLKIHASVDDRDGSALFQLDREWDIEGVTVMLGISLAG
ncbi:MAG TPA: isoleucine--tRNA ligase [Methanospirillum sp.]|uniref:isoleucine--tRNA ligase n=1 Tax=Methanospirillum sp. TaxID=45200 RepID=UPI002CF6C1B0|nr:isoleucine--tRNA ligase [Methanospirillum sp.]HOJ96260.1 isoleucine--tRNA ligase [Methanospirillum sp.]HPP77188.1 isoleucine--tRNA ligase [Methanospirillum sp.]